jgi:hypothetical protein
MRSNRPPIAIIFVACLYILVGVAGFTAHFKELITRQPDAPLMELTELIALFCGVFLLRRQNWARWLALAWIVFHVIISAFHPLPELAMHALFCVVIAWALFRRESNAYFRGSAQA